MSDPDVHAEFASAGEAEVGTAQTLASAAPQAVAAAAAEAQQPAAPAQIVYVGPRLPHPYPVARLAVFRGDLPVPLAKAVIADADLAALFVPVAETAKALKAVDTAGTTLARAAAAVSAKYLRKEG